MGRGSEPSAFISHTCAAPPGQSLQNEITPPAGVAPPAAAASATRQRLLAIIAGRYTAGATRVPRLGGWAQGQRHDRAGRLRLHEPQRGRVGAVGEEPLALA